MDKQYSATDLSAFPPEAQTIILQQQALIQQLTQQVEALLRRVQQLEDQLSKNSRNSGKPPSSDGLKKPKPKSLREKGKRKSGGQEGHEGTTLLQVENPDEVVKHEQPQCPQCQQDLTEANVVSVTKRQVFELPPLRLQVTEHQAITRECPCCGEQVRGTFPAEVSQPTQYGEHFKALLVYLSGYQLLPLARITELVADCFGQSISEDTVTSALYSSSLAVTPSLEAIETGIIQSAVAHADETGMRVVGKLHWLHVVSTSLLTRYGVHAKRGQEALEALQLVPKFKGELVHDGWRAYTAFDQCGHALCNAHLLRELTFLAEQHQQQWADELKTLLVEMKKAVEQTQAQGQTELDTSRQQVFIQRYMKLVQRGLELNPPPEPPSGKRRVAQSPPRKLLLRLERDAHAFLAFMRDFRIPFDNNLAERDLRMMKVKQKISGAFRTLQGAELFARLRSYLSTARKQGQPMLQVLTDALLGNPFIPHTSMAG
jgi:transposase